MNTNVTRRLAFTSGIALVAVAAANMVATANATAASLIVTDDIDFDISHENVNVSIDNIERTVNDFLTQTESLVNALEETPHDSASDIKKITAVTSKLSETGIFLADDQVALTLEKTGGMKQAAVDINSMGKKLQLSFADLQLKLGSTEPLSETDIHQRRIMLQQWYEAELEPAVDYVNTAWSIMTEFKAINNGEPSIFANVQSSTGMEDAKTGKAVVG